MKTFKTYFTEAIEYNIGPVYHGTSGIFDVFEVGNKVGGGLHEGWDAFFFTNDIEVAREYALDSANRHGEEPVIKEAYLKINSPYHINPDALDEMGRGKNSKSLVKYLKYIQEEHDGIIAEAYDGGIEYVVFNNDQISVKREIDANI